MSNIKDLIKALIVVAFIGLPLAVSASQGSGTGTQSQGSGTGIDSQGSGTGRDSISLGSFVSSQGSGTGIDSQGSGTGRDSAGRVTWGAGYYSENIQFNIQPGASLWNCITSIQCLFNAGKYSEK